MILFLIGLERDRKDLENRAHELQINLDEAEANAIKWGRKMVAKLESRAKDIEGNEFPKLPISHSPTRMALTPLFCFKL